MKQTNQKFLNIWLNKIKEGNLQDFELKSLQKTPAYDIYQIDKNNKLLEIKSSEFLYDKDVEKYLDNIKYFGPLINVTKKLVNEMNKFNSFQYKHKFYVIFGDQDNVDLLKSLSDSLYDVINIFSILLNINNEYINDSIISDSNIKSGTIIKLKSETYIIEKYISSGSFGKVYKAEELSSGNHVAIKELEGINTESVTNELEILKYIELRGCNKNIQCFKNFFVNSKNKNLYLVTNFINGITLDKVINAYKNDNPDYLFYFINQILGVLKYINDIGLIHGDIKPENILCVWENDGYYPVLIDFGLSCIINKQLNSCNNNGGSLLFMAPEVLKSKIIYESSDIWSLGMIFYIYLVNQRPYGNGIKGQDDIKQRLEQICETGLFFNIQYQPLNDICNDMLICDHDLRLNARKLLDKYKNVLDELLKEN